MSYKFIDSNFVPYVPNKFLTFDDVSLLPQRSSLTSRNDPNISLSTKATSVVQMDIPLISANMDTVTEKDMAITLGKAGGLGILHKYYESEEAWISDIEAVVREGLVPAISIGIQSGDLDLVGNLLRRVDFLIVCVDVAHGHMQTCIEQVRKLKLTFNDKVSVIAGNVCTPAGVQDLVLAGADAVKIGVGNGSACSTRIVTGHGVPQITNILNARKTINSLKSNCAIIADGGIRNSGDIVKALAAGADSVMIGNLFAGTNESAGQDRQDDGSIKYRGQSSQDFLSDIEKTGVAAEGVHMYIQYRGSVLPIIDNLTAGIRSGMTYSGCKTLKEFYNKSQFIEITHNSYIEGTPHGLTRD